MSRYTIYEHDKIDYYKLRIKELRFLKREAVIVNEDLKEIEYRLKLISSSYLLHCHKIKYKYENINILLDEIIEKKEVLLVKKINISNNIENVYKILDSLTPITRKMAIDLFVNKITVSKACDKYNIANPYQTINDELRYVDVNCF